MSKSLSCHYHIRWSCHAPLDWQCFITAEEAESWAAQMARSGESYSAEKFDNDCVPCKFPSENSLLEVLAEAIKKGRGEFGSLQVLDTETGALRIVAQLGFSRKYLEFFSVVCGEFAACGTALKRGERVLVNDVMTDPIFKDKAMREVMQGEGILSVQAVPLATSAGRLVGVIAVQYRASHMPSISAHQLQSTYIQDVADLIERVTKFKSRQETKQK